MASRMAYRKDDLQTLQKQFVPKKNELKQISVDRLTPAMAENAYTEPFTFAHRSSEETKVK